MNLELNPKKSCLFIREVKYLGHIISTDRIKTNPEKAEAMKNWPVPKDEHEVRSFVALCTYQLFIKRFADISRPLHALGIRYLSVGYLNARMLLRI